MTERDQLIADAEAAVKMALAQLQQQQLVPIARLDQELRNAYWSIGNEQAAITQRFALQIQPGIAQLNAEHQAIADNLGAGLQPHFTALRAAVNAPANRIADDLHTAIRYRSAGGANGA